MDNLKSECLMSADDTKHIAIKVRTANAIVGQIRRAFTHLDCQTFKKLYTAFVRPHLEYAQAVWTPISRKLVNMIENVQIRATKLVNGMGNMEYTERLAVLDLPTLSFRRLRGDMIELYKHFNKCDRTTITSTFQQKARPSRIHKLQIQDIEAKDGARGVQRKSFYFRNVRL